MQRLLLGRIGLCIHGVTMLRVSQRSRHDTAQVSNVGGVTAGRFTTLVSIIQGMSSESTRSSESRRHVIRIQKTCHQNPEDMSSESRRHVIRIQKTCHQNQGDISSESRRHVIRIQETCRQNPEDMSSESRRHVIRI